RPPGYVEYVVLDKGRPGAAEAEEGEEGAAESGDEPSDGDAEAPERTVVQERVRDLKARGYANADIAVLTYKNDNVVRVSSWLNEAGIPFIPFSSLDIRKRAVIREILSLLLFLDSPTDDLSFASFLLGRVLGAKAGRDGPAFAPEHWHRFLFDCRKAEVAPLYIALRKRHPEVWGGLFERLFKSVGYYPLYDLVTLAFRVFDVFRLFPEEEGALVKLLEVIRDFEGTGRNDLREFLAYAGRGEGEASAWTIDVPSGTDAVKVMSIHKAKGLGFPAVLLLLYGESFRPPDFFLDEESGGVRVYKINKALSATDERLARLYEEERTREAVNRLNTLYVGLTRARSELQVIAVKGRTKGYPFDLLGTEGYASSQERPPAPVSVGPGEPPPADVARFGEAPVEAPRPARKPGYGRSVRRGELAHEILAGLEVLREGWEADVAAIVDALPLAGPDRDLADDAGRAVVAAMRAFPRQDLFRAAPGRRVLRESTLCDRSGRAFRIDRLILDGERAVVIDFKTGVPGGAPGGEDRKRADREQIRAYTALVEEAMPGVRASGLLVYLDQGVWEDVE
ncbi:MAG: hypothetical protein JW742_00915, partial [Candidatus Aminicenantes bacterium]|nr:hypothetical protein [Candidatus Aminicenantes bacterium]